MASGEIRLSTTTMRQMPVLAQSQQTLPDCLAAASSPGGSTGSDGDVGDVLSNLGQVTTALDTTFERLLGASAVSLGQAMGSPAGVLAPSNAAYAQVGSQVQNILGTAAPWITYGGYGLGAVSVAYSTIRGYATGGPQGALSGAAYSTADFAVETALAAVGNVPGAALGYAYDRSGGTRAFVAAQASVVAQQACYAVAGFLTGSGMR